MADQPAASKKSTPAKKAPAKKTAAKKSAVKKSAAKKSAAAKTTPAKKAPAKKAAAKKTAAKKAPAKKAPAKKSGASARARRAPTSRFFRQAQERAAKVIQDPEAIKRVAEEASSRVNRSGPFAAVLEDFRTLVRLVTAYARGQYRDIPPDQLAIVVAGLIYVVSPVDLIPDVLPGGFLDDAFVIGWVLKTVRGELDAFREWEAAQ